MNTVAINPSVWHSLCRLDDLVPGSGVAVRLPAGAAAIFWLPASEPALYAISHRDPRSGAEVLAHGLVCEHDGEWLVASPLYKERFRLRDGSCRDNPALQLKVWPIRLLGEDVQVQL